ncbi:MAG: LPS-assembly protein LptD [Neisseria sp.]|nr:LPS-assembly protein LptD [Neisseria sp.]
MARLFLVKPLVVAAGMAAVAGAAAETSPLGKTCPACADGKVLDAETEPAVQTSGQPALPADYTRVTADTVAGQTRVGVEARGGVIVERNGQTLNADRVQYNQQADTVRAEGNVVLDDGGSQVRSESMEYDLGKSSGTAKTVRLEAEKEGRRLQAAGKEAQMKSKSRYSLKDVRFNTCQRGDASWYIRADSVEADYDKGVGVAKKAKLVLGGVPVLYTPWADFPLNGNRKSGLLVPTLKVGSDGTEIEVPYYFNLAPNYDATFSPRLISSRGLQLGGEFRYLQAKYGGEINGRWMPNDQRSRHNNRYQFQWRHQQQFGAGFRAGVDFNQVSDDDYYRDFYNREDIARNVNLNREVWLENKTDVLGAFLVSRLIVKKYQTLANADGHKDEPYAILPRLSGSWQKNLGNAQINIDGQYTRFEHDEKQSGSRTVFYPSVSYHFHNRWGYIRPKAGLHYTYYSLDAFRNRSGRNAGRGIPIANVDAGMTFERQTSLFGRDLVQTLEPRLFYNYIPTRSQNDLPNFDTSPNSFNYQQLFRENLYSGNDRINAANSLTTAVQTRYLDRESGEERARAGIGQKFYFKDDKILMDGSVEKGTRTRSDWVAFAEGGISDSLSGQAAVHFNENSSRFDNVSAGLLYRPEEGKALSARYTYGRDEPIYLQSNGEYFRDKLSQVDVAAQWPLRRNLYGVARFNYATNVKKPLEMLAGLEYKSECGCWSASAVGQRYVSGWDTGRNNANYKNAFFFTLQLKDLSNIGKNTDILNNAIPGYTKTNEVVKP